MMSIVAPIFSCILLLFSNVFAGQEFSIFHDNVCEQGIATWTSWFDTQNPLISDGNDIEEFATIQKLSEEANQCTSVLNVEFSIIEESNNETVPYQTTINHNGLFCTGSQTSPCPNYQVRFCCPLLNHRRNQQCGQTFRQPVLGLSARIINGIKTVPHSFPWAVSLQYKGVHDCGGVIIDQWNILTAAHCLDYSHDLGNYFVHVGAHDRRSSGQLMPTAKLIIHPNYNELRSSDDIGIIRLAKPITFSSEIQPICLLDNIVEPPLDTTVYIAGWGNTNYMMSSTSQVLLQARLRVVASCSMYPNYNPQKQICAASNGPTDLEHGSCQGDSGGGLLYSKNNRWYVAGVVNFATGCGLRAFPTVYAKTSAYIGWIQSMINSPI